MSYRIERINSEMLKSISNIIANRVKDPNVEGMVSVLDVNVTKDLKYAKVYVSVFAGDSQKTVAATLYIPSTPKNQFTALNDLRMAQKKRIVRLAVQNRRFNCFTRPLRPDRKRLPSRNRDYHLRIRGSVQYIEPLTGDREKAYLDENIKRTHRT